jgi:predicted 3-demethylubiquinone-9 3-methyltransferase (glyoxalase superfamily)
MQKITPFLWFDTQAEEAMNFYVSIFKNAKAGNVNRMPDGATISVSFELEGLEFIGLNAGPEFKFNEAISLFVDCGDQAEVDELWNALAEGGKESRCGWVQDKFGMWWQIIPKQLGELMGDSDPEKASRTMQAMMKMGKIIVADLQAAHDDK